MNKAIAVMIFVLLCFGTAAQSDVFNMPTGFTRLETVVVGNPGNKADDTG